MGCDVALVALLIFCPDFNPRAPCGVRRRDPYPENRGGGISIHAPLAGRDDCRKGRIDRILVFQSTRPLRGATYDDVAVKADIKFQSTRPMRGATDWTG